MGCRGISPTVSRDVLLFWAALHSSFAHTDFPSATSLLFLGLHKYVNHAPYMKRVVAPLFQLKTKLWNQEIWATKGNSWLSPNWVTYQFWGDEISFNGRVSLVTLKQCGQQHAIMSSHMSLQIAKWWPQRSKCTGVDLVVDVVVLVSYSNSDTLEWLLYLYSLSVFSWVIAEETYLFITVTSGPLKQGIICVPRFAILGCFWTSKSMNAQETFQLCCFRTEIKVISIYIWHWQRKCIITYRYFNL